MQAQRAARVSLLLHKDSIYEILKSSLEAQLQGVLILTRSQYCREYTVLIDLQL